MGKNEKLQTNLFRKLEGNQLKKTLKFKIWLETVHAENEHISPPVPNLSCARGWVGGQPRDISVNCQPVPCAAAWERPARA